MKDLRVGVTPGQHVGRVNCRGEVENCRSNDLLELRWAGVSVSRWQVYVARHCQSCYPRSVHSEPVWPSGKALSPFLTGRMFVRRTYLGQYDEL